MLEGLDINELDDGLIIFSESTDTVHHLNHTAAVVLQLCDGSRDTAEIAEVVAATFGLAEAPTADVADCVRDLSAKGLVH
jgi:hypothetical protein